MLRFFGALKTGDCVGAIESMANRFDVSQEYCIGSSSCSVRFFEDESSVGSESSSGDKAMAPLGAGWLNDVPPLDFLLVGGDWGAL